MCSLFSRLPQASLLQSDSFFSGAVCFVRRTLARSAFHGFSIGFQRCKSVPTRTVRAACMVHLLFATPLGLAASLRSDGFVSGAVSFIRRTLARSAFLGFQIWILKVHNCVFCVNLVDLVKGFQTSIYLQKSVSIQPRTGFSKFAKI